MSAQKVVEKAPGSNDPKKIKENGMSLLAASAAPTKGEKYNFDIVAIHGLGGHPYDTWSSGSPPDEKLWLRDFLPRNLPGARVFTYGYDSGVFFSTSTGDMHSYALGLLNNLNLERQEQSVRTLINSRLTSAWVNGIRLIELLDDFNLCANGAAGSHYPS